MKFNYEGLYENSNKDFEISSRDLLKRCQKIEALYQDKEFKSCCVEVRESNELLLRYLYDRLIGIAKKNSVPMTGQILNDSEFITKINYPELTVAAKDVQRIGNQYAHTNHKANETLQQYEARMLQLDQELIINTDIILEKFSVVLSCSVDYINHHLPSIRGHLEIELKRGVNRKNGNEENLLVANLTDVVDRKDYKYIWRIEGQGGIYAEWKYKIPLDKQWMVGKTITLTARLKGGADDNALTASYGPISENEILTYDFSPQNKELQVQEQPHNKENETIKHPIIENNPDRDSLELGNDTDTQKVKKRKVRIKRPESHDVSTDKTEFNDYEEKIFQECRADALEGYKYSMKDLGICYLLGYGVKEDKKMAKKWFEKAEVTNDWDITYEYDFLKFPLVSMIKALGGRKVIGYFFQWILPSIVALSILNGEIIAKFIPFFPYPEIVVMLLIFADFLIGFFLYSDHLNMEVLMECLDSDNIRRKILQIISIILCFIIYSMDFGLVFVYILKFEDDETLMKFMIEDNFFLVLKALYLILFINNNIFFCIRSKEETQMEHNLDKKLNNYELKIKVYAYRVQFIFFLILFSVGIGVLML